MRSGKKLLSVVGVHGVEKSLGEGVVRGPGLRCGPVSPAPLPHALPFPLWKALCQAPILLKMH